MIDLDQLVIVAEMYECCSALKFSKLEMQEGSKLHLDEFYEIWMFSLPLRLLLLYEQPYRQHFIYQNKTFTYAQEGVPTAGLVLDKLVTPDYPIQHNLLFSASLDNFRGSEFDSLSAQQYCFDINAACRPPLVNQPTPPEKNIPCGV